MRALVVILAVAGSIGLFSSACINNGLTLSCEPETCTGNANTYQICDSTSGAITYKFGDQACTGSTGSTTALEACMNEVDVYCGVATSSEDGGGAPTTGGGTSGPPCTYTASGAATGSGSCTVNAAYDSSKGGIAFAVTSSTGVLEFGATLANQTTLAAGTYTLASVASGAGAEFLPSASSSSAYELCNSTSNCDDAQGNPSASQGSFTLTITNPGPVADGVLWSSPSGTLFLTLPAQPNGIATGTVTVTITL